MNTRNKDSLPPKTEKSTFATEIPSHAINHSHLFKLTRVLGNAPGESSKPSAQQETKEKKSHCRCC